MNNYRFTLVNRWIYPDSYGGVSMHNEYLIKAIYETYNCNIISFKSKINKIYYKKNKIDYKEIDVPNFFLFRALSKIKNISNGLRYLSDVIISKRIRNKIDKCIDLVEFMDIHTEGYSYIKKKRFGKAIIIIRSHTPWTILRNYYTKNERKGVDSWLAFKKEKFCFNNCDAITTPSYDLKNKLIKVFKLNPEKITVMPNLIDTNHFKPLDDFRNKKEGFRILHVGRFERAKGVETLIKSFVILSTVLKNIELINIGQPRGSSFKNCMNMLEKGKLVNKVTFTGFVEYNELPNYYAQSDIVVIPSEIYESFSYTTAQGMSCGKPVIASNIGGIPETLNNGKAGLLFNPGDVDDLNEKIKKLYYNERKRNSLAKKARIFSVNNFSINSLKPKYIEYYNSFLN